VITPSVEEKQTPEETPVDFAKRMALEKAISVAANNPDDVVLGCDTVVVLNGKTILGKPRSKKDAKNMLTRLAGREHTVLSSVAAVWHRKNKQRVVTVESRVRIKQLEDWEINWYLETSEPMDKAGAYAIQGRGAIFVEGIVGSHTNVIGLPLMETVMLLRSFGVRL
jgi:septum formation protein